jgi:hypothetical protein
MPMMPSYREKLHADQEIRTSRHAFVRLGDWQTGNTANRPICRDNIDQEANTLLSKLVKSMKNKNSD